MIGIKMDYHIEDNEFNFRTVTSLDGVKTTTSIDTFEIKCLPNAEVWEQLSVQMLKDWIKRRKKCSGIADTSDIEA